METSLPPSPLIEREEMMIPEELKGSKLTRHREVAVALLVEFAASVDGPFRADDFYAYGLSKGFAEQPLDSFKVWFQEWLKDASVLLEESGARDAFEYRTNTHGSLVGAVALKAAVHILTPHAKEVQRAHMAADEMRTMLGNVAFGMPREALIDWLETHHALPRQAAHEMISDLMSSGRLVTAIRASKLWLRMPAETLEVIEETPPIAQVPSRQSAE